MTATTKPEGELSRNSVVITVFNQKGGVGKTTTSVNLAVCLVALGRRVVLVDLDSQSNATSNVGLTPPVPTGSYHLITGHAGFAECLLETPYGGLFLVGGSDELAWADIELALGKDPEKGMIRALATLPDDVDVVVIDCPPAPGIVSVNALVAADMVVMPVMPSPHALAGLHKAWWNVNRIRNRFNRDLQTIHILLTMTEGGDLTERLSADIAAEFGRRVLPMPVPRDHVVIEGAARDLPVVVLAPNSAPAQAYLGVAEILVDATGEDAAKSRLEQWCAALAGTVQHTEYAGAPQTGDAPVVGWTGQAAEGEAKLPDYPAPGLGWRFGVSVLLVGVGAVLGFAAALAILHGPNLPLPW